MEGLIRCCYELMNIELRAGILDHFDELRDLARMIDIQRRYAIIEERGWVTINGRHVYIGNDKGGKSGGGRKDSDDKTSRKVESDLYKQDSTSLKRSIRRYKKRIDEHKDKISHPEKYVRDWGTYDDRKRNGLLKHWNKEIINFSDSIQRRADELKKRGDYDE